MGVLDDTDHRTGGVETISKEEEGSEEDEGVSEQFSSRVEGEEGKAYGNRLYSLTALMIWIQPMENQWLPLGRFGPRRFFWTMNHGTPRRTQ
jgi:hypothetical protein